MSTGIYVISYTKFAHLYCSLFCKYDFNLILNNRVDAIVLRSSGREHHKWLPLYLMDITGVRRIAFVLDAAYCYTCRTFRGLSGCVGQTGESCRNDWTDNDTVWGVDSYWYVLAQQTTQDYRTGSTLASTGEYDWSVRDGDAVVRQITLTACSLLCALFALPA